MMFRQLIATAIALVMMLTATGCNKPDEATGGTRTTPATTAGDTSATTTIGDAVETTTGAAETTTTTAEATTTTQPAETTTSADGTTAGGTRTTPPTQAPVKTTAAAPTATKATKAPTTAATTTKAPTTTAANTQPTEVRADGTVIKLFPDDPWRYPYDTDQMIADCKAYIESKGLIWDNALNVDKGTWAGKEDSGGYTLKPEKFDFKTAVYGKIDFEAWSWETHKYFKCVFIPSDTSKGDYDIYVVHSGRSYAGDEDMVVHEEFAERAKKAIN